MELDVSKSSLTNLLKSCFSLWGVTCVEWFRSGAVKASGQILRVGCLIGQMKRLSLRCVSAGGERSAVLTHSH